MMKIYPIHQDLFLYMRKKNGDNGQVYNYPITSSNFSLWNRLKTEGTGFNVKLGLIARVTDYWRLGLAFHTPTYYSMSDYYMASVDNDYTYLKNNSNESRNDITDSPEGRYDYSLVTPWKFMASTAFIMGKKELSVLIMNIRRMTK